MTRLTVAAELVLHQCRENALDGLKDQYDPDALEPADFAADLIRHLSQVYFSEARVQDPAFWVV